LVDLAKAGMTNDIRPGVGLGGKHAFVIKGRRCCACGYLELFAKRSDAVVRK
jgi:hypothetical protein